MPVRIYEIAKHLGIPSKEVLAKAKELGVVGARVPSSSLDKITAEYLEDTIRGTQSKEETPEPPAAPEPVIIVKAAPEEEAAPPKKAPKPKAPEAAASDEPLQGGEASEPVTPAAETAQDSTISTPPPEEAAVEESNAPAVAAESDAAPPDATAPKPIPTEAPTPSTATEADTTGEMAEPEPLPAVESEAQVPPGPPKILLGGLVGRIQLPQRPTGRPAAKRGPNAKPERPGDRREAGATRASAKPAESPPAKQAPKYTVPAGAKVITLKQPITVRDLAEKMGRKPHQVIADLMELNIFATVNQAIDEPIAQQVAAKHRFRLELEKRERGGGVVHAPIKPVEKDEDDQAEDLLPRAPVVTIMGHVDHGKTTLLDTIRKTNVVAKEAGGITQHIGAYTISIPHPEKKKQLQQITFLDTPGHAAFSAMRARGADVTDIVILVVAANDGAMPQTVEAINHARAANVPIIVAVNKCDHPNATPMKPRQELQEKGLACEEWGGDTIFVDISALTGQGVDKLLEMLVLQAEIMELKANPNRPARGNVIESAVEPGGPTATMLVRKGTLKIGDIILCGQNWGKVKALVNEEGKRLKQAGPSEAVKVLGLDGAPLAGQEFTVLSSDKDARAMAQERRDKARAVATNASKGLPTKLDDFLKPLDSKTKELKLVVKGDTQGSVEAIVEALKKIESDKVQVEIIHHAVGSIAENDVMLAAASKGVVIGFHTRVDTSAAEAAKRMSVPIKLYSIIYELIDQVKDEMVLLLDPVLQEAVVGTAEVRQVFALSKGGNVAGCVVTNGRLVKGRMRVRRGRNVIFEGRSASLRRFQDEVNEVRSGLECGIRLDGFNEFEPHDTIECFTMEKVAQTL